MRNLTFQSTGPKFPSQTITMSSPYGGLNTRDPLNAMSPTDAVIMDNFFPDVGGVFTRKGRVKVIEGDYGFFESAYEYFSTTFRELISMGDGKIYKGATTATITELADGYASDRWQCVNFGGYLLGVNGTDTPFKYDGTTLTDNTFTGPTDPTNLVGISVYNNRLFLWENDSQDFWYGAVDAITGALTNFPLSRLSKFGGNIIAIEPWSIDTKGGLEDFLAIFLTSGDIVLYKGSDPSDADNWFLAGYFRTSPLINARAITKVAGDLIFVTAQDVMSFTDIYNSGGTITTFSKLSGAISDAVSRYGTNFGWQVFFYQAGRKVLINVPTTGIQSIQYVVNASTGAACKFTNWNATSFVAVNNVLYYTDKSVGTIRKADFGTDDDGQAINCFVKSAYNNFGSLQDKCIKVIRPVWNISGSVGMDGFNIGLDFDYKNSNITTPVSPYVNTGTLWGSPWGSPWSGTTTISTNSYIINGHGVDASFLARVRIKGETISWLRNDYQYQINEFVI